MFQVFRDFFFLSLCFHSLIGGESQSSPPKEPYSENQTLDASIKVNSQFN